MDAFFTKLPNRGLIHLEGDDRHDFLQGLITNDIEKLEPGKALYACLLTPQGKFLHDFFISDGDRFTLLECEGDIRAQDLFERLNKYRLRADVQISVEEDVPVYVIFGNQNTPGYTDPRDPEMGYRSFEKPDGLEEKPFEEWDIHRIKLGIPDGSRDMIPGKSTLDEANIERWNGVSYEKGCYVGQELTARMHHRGLGKKHLQTVQLGSLPDKAELRSSCGDIGLALIRE
ncbi:MAG: glycine cleavage system protein T [Micavibrio sp.]|nr:MAG: glycine cleavage system protein T [Micavibrio sp.]